jgi:hypothetical protein
MNQSAQKAQKISLGAAVFDKEGRILVDSDGLLPSTTITDSFIQVVSGCAFFQTAKFMSN